MSKYFRFLINDSNPVKNDELLVPELVTRRYDHWYRLSELLL